MYFFMIHTNTLIFCFCRHPLFEYGRTQQSYCSITSLMVPALNKLRNDVVRVFLHLFLLSYLFCLFCSAIYFWIFVYHCTSSPTVTNDTKMMNAFSSSYFNTLVFNN